MTKEEFDVACFAASGGVVAGAALGYWLRGIAQRVKNHVRHRMHYESESIPSSLAMPRPREQRARDVMRERQVIPLEHDLTIGRHVPVNARGVGKVTVTELHNPDRDDVIRALVDAGYKKTAAVEATDACTLAERASGAEAWVVCALRKASKGGS